jgi:hypothetical protein
MLHVATRRLPLRPRGWLRPGLGLGVQGRLSGLRRDRLIDFQVRHFQFAEKIEEQGVFFGREIALRFFVKGIEHVDEFVGGFGVDHGLTGARVGIGAENHGGIAADHSNEIFEGLRALGYFDGRLLRRGGRFRRFGCGMAELFALGFALPFFHGFFAGFTFGGEGAAVDDAEGFFFVVLMIGQGDNPLGIYLAP